MCRKCKTSIRLNLPPRPAPAHVLVDSKSGLPVKLPYANEDGRLIVTGDGRPTSRPAPAAGWRARAVASFAPRQGAPAGVTFAARAATCQLGRGGGRASVQEPARGRLEPLLPQ